MDTFILKSLGIEILNNVNVTATFDDSSFASISVINWKDGSERALWLEKGNLNHLPFGMILDLDIGLLYPSRLLRHKISQKKWKRPKIFFEGHIKDQVGKKYFL